jgi:hypothetical protein
VFVPHMMTFIIDVSFSELCQITKLRFVGAIGYYINEDLGILFRAPIKCETKRNETKSTKTKRNETKSTKTKRNEINEMKTK